MFKSEFLNKLVAGLCVAVVAMCALTGLWNWVMPTLGIAKLTVWQFSALFIVAHSLTFEIVSFKKTTKTTENVRREIV